MHSEPSQVAVRPDNVAVETEVEAPGAESSHAGIPGSLRIAIPSVTDIIFLVLVGGFAVGALSTKLLGDAGTGWHIRNGELMLATHSITRIDPFSSTMAGHAWYAWEWLYDLAIAGVHHWAGLNGVVFITALLIGLAFASAFWLTVRRGSSMVVAALLVMLSIFASSIHFFARPHVLSWIFTLIWFEILDRAEVSPQAASRLWSLPLLTLLWVNVHGGFVLGFVLLALYLIAGVIAWFRAHVMEERNRFASWLKQLAGVTLISAAATLVNPYGYRLHAHIYKYLTDRFLMNHIEEFQSPNFHGLAQQCFLVLLLITVIALASIRGRFRVSHLLLVVAASYGGLYASRNLPTSSILLTLIIGPVLSRTIADAAHSQQVVPSLRRGFAAFNAFDRRMRRMELDLPWHLWPAAAVVLGLIICGQQGSLGGHQIMHAHFSVTRFPVQAVNVIQQRDIRQPTFTPDYWGGYLIYRLYPHNLVVIDDRHDLYGDRFLKNYLKVLSIQPGWEQVLRQANVNWMLLPTGSTTANMLNQMPQWKKVYADKVAVLYQRAQ